MVLMVIAEWLFLPTVHQTTEQKQSFLCFGEQFQNMAGQIEFELTMEVILLKFGKI